MDAEIEHLRRCIGDLTEANARLKRENDDRKRAEDALRASEVDLLKIINALPTTAWSTRPDGYCDFLSNRWLDYAGFTSEQAEGWGWKAAIHPDDACSLVERWYAALAAGTPVEAEARIRRFDGAYRWFLFRANPLRDEQGTIIKWYGTNIDIEEHKRVDALRQTEFQSRLILNTIPGFVALFSPEGLLDGANEQFLGYMGLTLEEAGEWATNGAVHVDDLANTSERFTHSLVSGEPYDFESRIRGSNGIYRWFQIRGNPSRDANGRTVRWHGLLTDIDDRKRAEEHREQAEEALSELRSELAHISRVSSLGILTASVAHEVNQPLSGIITNTSTCLRMLAANPPNVEGAIETARRTMRDGKRASEVVGRLRALFLKQTAKSEEVDLNEAAAEVIPLASGDLQRNHVTLRVDFAGQLPRFIADRVQLQQVILNLLLNASDAMRGVDDRQRLVVISTTATGEEVTLSVKDVGVGFANEDVERLFQAFYTTKSSGMGVGLSVSRSIIESHNGRIWGEPNDGGGATFSFSIPVVTKVASSTAASE